MRIAVILFIGLFMAWQDSCAQSVKVAYESNFGPYTYQNEAGEAKGALIDIFNLWASKAGIDIEYVPCEETECLNTLLNDQTDILISTNPTIKDKRLLLTPPIIRLSTSLFVKDDRVPKSLMKFNDTVTIIKDTPIIETIREEYPSLMLQEVESHTELEMMVKNQVVNAFIFEMPDPTDADLRMTIPDGYTRYQHLATIEFRPVIRSGSKDLIRSLIEDGETITTKELIEISTRHNLYMAKKPNYYFVYIAIVGVLLFIVIFLLIRNKYLRSRGTRIVSEEHDWQSVIENGENDKVEFKSSFHWDYRQEKTNKALEAVIMKTISAFLNADGGILMIGVDDEGKVLGLQKDYDSFKKSNSDGFMLVMTNLVNQSFGKDIHRLLKITIAGIGEKEICAVSVLPSEKPIFIGQKGNEEFYVRASASSQPLSMSEALNYIKEHWPES